MAHTGRDDQSRDGRAATTGRNWGVGVAVGLSIGVALGLALDNLVVGLALGVAFFPLFAMLRGGTTPEDDVPRDDERPPGGDA